MSKPLRVLIVEDSEDDALLLVHELQRGGYDPIFERVETEEAMTAALKKQVWDIVLSDYSMPHFSAPESLRLLQQSGMDLPYIVISGTIGEEVAVATMKAGAHDYLMKNNLKRLVPGIERELRDAETRRQRRQAQHNLNERVKELQCLYGIAMITERPDITLDAAYQEATNLITQGWQYSDITCAQLTIDGKEFKTANYRETEWKQASDIIVDGQRIGTVEVCYLEEKPEIEEGPFLKEERALINGITNHLGSFIQRKRAEEAKEHLYLMLRTIRNVNQLIVKEKNRDRLLKSICDNFTKTRGCSAAWIALLDESGRLITVAESGWGKDFLPIVRRLKQGELPGCGRRALQQSAVVVTEESAPACTGCPLAKGYYNRGAMTARLEHNGKVYGFLSANLPVRFVTEPEEVSLFGEVAGDIAYALHAIELGKERKQAEAKHSLVIKTALDGFWICDLKGRFLEVNDSSCKVLGYTREELLTMSISDIEVIEKPEETVQHVKKVMEQGYDRFETRHRCKDGKILDVEISTNYIHVVEGQLFVFVRDITERKRAEETVRESEEHYRSIFEDSRDSVYITTRDGKFIDANQSALDLFGYSREEMTSVNTLQLYVNPSDAGRFQKEIEKKGFLRDYEVTFRKKDGTEIDCLLNTTLRRANDGSILAYQGIIRDMTEHKKLEAQLRQAQKMEAIGALAGGVAHDFNNLLTTIIGCSDLMMMRIGKDHELRGNLEDIRKAGDRAASLTRQLLAFSRKQILEPKVIDLNHVIPDMDKMLRRLIGEDIDLKTVLAPDLGRVEADPGQIEQIIMNLAVNARDAMPRGGKLTMETANVDLNEAYARSHVAVTPGLYVMMAISDSGTGMDEETLSKVFDPFFTTKEEGKGTGLGLSMVYGIVKQSNGNIWVYSEPGKGTTFKIYLPRVEKDAVEKEEVEATAESLTGSETILVVEDNEMVRDLAQTILQHYGYSVLTAQDGEEAMKVSKEHDGPIDLMLTDVVMPKMSGREVAERLNALQPDMKVLYMSGYTGNAIVHHGVLDREMRFIQKPFTAESLARKVREVLD